MAAHSVATTADWKAVSMVDHWVARMALQRAARKGTTVGLWAGNWADPKAGCLADQSASLVYLSAGRMAAWKADLLAAKKAALWAHSRDGQKGAR